MNCKISIRFLIHFLVIFTHFIVLAHNSKNIYKIYMIHPIQDVGASPLSVGSMD